MVVKHTTQEMMHDAIDRTDPHNVLDIICEQLKIMERRSVEGEIYPIEQFTTIEWETTSNGDLFITMKYLLDDGDPRLCLHDQVYISNETLLTELEKRGY